MRGIGREQVIYFLVYVVLQLPVLHRFVLFNAAFTFFYISFLLVLPLAMGRLSVLFIAFGTGLLVDIFSNTPGIHASACLLLAVLQKPWLTMVVGAPEEDARVSIHNFGLRSMTIYALPLIFIHHFQVFLIEHGSFSAFGLLLKRAVLSALLTGIIFLSSNALLSSKTRRL
ncbi:MAG: hypothetical protein R8G66_28050 [Cytophagales bacterium]|nr:hypothetical protein [Cytophagales bacterium]